MSDSEYEFDDAKTGCTSVLLGFTSREASRTDLSVLGNHVGGIPVWLGDEAPSADLLRCKVCNKDLALLAQLSCPLPEKDYDRVLYVLVCTDSNCRRKEGSIRAIRGIESNESVRERIRQEMEESQPENNLVPKQGTLGDSLFGSSTDNGSTNPFGVSSFDASTATAAQEAANNKSKAQAKANKDKSTKKRDLRIVQGKYVCKLIEVEDEVLELPTPVDQLKGIKIEELDTEVETEGSGDSGKLTSAQAKEIEARSDPVFAHFVDIVSSNPGQVLRYERGLTPLLYSNTDGVAEKLKNLKNKTLEVQLMPHLIAEVETDDMMLEGMEWGSIFVATDSEDALPKLDDNGIGYTEEWLAVQWE